MDSVARKIKRGTSRWNTLPSVHTYYQFWHQGEPVGKETIVEERDKLGWITGPAITKQQGPFYSSRDLDGVMHEFLEEIFEEEI